MANVLITGGAGFLGSRLARALLTAGSVDIAGTGPQHLVSLTVLDQVAPPPDLMADDRVTGLVGDLNTLVATDGPARSAVASADVVFHLAAAVSGECEADFDLGIRANLRASEALLAACRAAATDPVVVFSSSVAAFGGSAEHPLPAVVTDDTLPNPQTSYGIQKFIIEQLVADYTRKGFLRGRSLRLMTVSVRPGRPNAAASGFFSGIIREPLAGQRAVCPVDKDTAVVLASPDRTIEGLLLAAAAGDADWGGRTAVNLPALTVTVAEMVAALERAAGSEAAALIDWQPDPVIIGMVETWPTRVRADRAARLGLVPDPDFDSIIAIYLRETAAGA